ncbi:MAG: serine/threonine protein phosphatase [Bacteroidetes bacterium]|nr:MAG: serine/threonine protein phosphatase [Bacteroidota bacterium]
MGLIAIGDIHGCAKSLDGLIREIAPTQEDHLVFIGDYIDRGPDSKGVIERLLKLDEEFKCTFLRGNHEDLLLGYLDRGEYDIFAMNGGIATLSSYMTGDGEMDIPQSHTDFVRETELYLETDDFLFVHAGLRPDMTVAENLKEGNPEVFLWERSHLKEPNLSWEKTVVCGHTPQPKPTNDPLLINIDTGCVYYAYPSMGFLTAVRLPEREFISVPYMG